MLPLGLERGGGLGFEWGDLKKVREGIQWGKVVVRCGSLGGVMWGFLGNWVLWFREWDLIM